MANYFVRSGGGNTPPYGNWTDAATSLTTAIAAATVNGDRVIIQYDAVPSGDAEVTVDTTYTLAANIAIISASNDGGTSFTPTAMGTTYWIGNSTTNRTITFAGAFSVSFYGITVRNAGTAADSLYLCDSDGADYRFDTCYFWHGNTNTTATAGIFLGSASTNRQKFLLFHNCTFRFGATAQRAVVAGNVQIIGGSISSAGSSPSNLFNTVNAYSPVVVVCEGFDMSHLGSNSIIGDHTTIGIEYRFYNCKLGTSYSILASQTVANKSSAYAYVYNCASGDKHSVFEYHDSFGSLVTIDTTDATPIYCSTNGAKFDGTNGFSWKIVTTGNCSYYTPFVTPWFGKYHDGTSAITPRIECMRDNSSGAVWQDDEVWGEFSYQGATGYPIASFVNDRKALTAGAVDQDSSSLGASDWVGETGTPGFFKLNPSSTITPAEIGHLMGRVCVGEPSITVYVDPTVRT